MTAPGACSVPAKLDLFVIGEWRVSLDTDGYYSRPDVFELSVDTRAKDGVRWQR